MSELGSSIDVQDLVNGKGEWTNIQEVLRSAVVDVIRAVSRVDEKFVRELENHGKDMHQVRNHLVRAEKAHETAFKTVGEHVAALEDSLESYAKSNDINDLKDQLLVFVHTKTKELASSSVVSTKQFSDLRSVLEGLPSKDDFERVIAHMKQVEAKNRKIAGEMAEIRDLVTRLGDSLAEKPDKTHYDTLTKRLLFLDRKVKAYSDKSDKQGRRVYDIEESLLQLPSKETIEELGDHIVGLVQAARMELGEQIGHATSKVDGFESVVNSKASKSDMATELYAISRKVEDLSSSLSGKALKSDLDLFVRDLSVLETSTVEWKGKSMQMVKSVEDLRRDVESRLLPRDLDALEQKVYSVMDSRAEEVSVMMQDEITSMKQIHSDLNMAKADKQDVKKVSKQMTSMNTRFRDWHDLIRQANARASDLEEKLATLSSKEDHQALQKVVTSATTKIKLLGEDQDKLKKKVMAVKEEVGTLPVRKDLEILNESLTSQITAEARGLHSETMKVSEALTKLVETSLPQEYATKEDVNVSKDLAVREAKHMVQYTNETVSDVEKKLALVNSEMMDQLAKKATMHRLEQIEKTFNSKIASTSQDCTEQVRQGQLRMDRIESQLESKSDKLDYDMFARDLSSLEQVTQLFTQQTGSRLESLDSKVVSLAESLNDQVEVSKKLHMDFLQKPDRDDVKLLVLAEVNSKTKGMEQDTQSVSRKIAELTHRVDNQQLTTNDARDSWQEDHAVLREEVKKVCEDLNAKHTHLVTDLKDDTMKTMETVLEGLHKHQKETNAQMLDFEQQMRRRFEDASSELNQQHNHEVATRIENETAIADNIRKLQVHLLQLDEAHASFKDSLKHSVDAGGGIQDKVDALGRQMVAKFETLSSSRSNLEQDVNMQVIALQKKFTDVSRDIVEAVDGRLSRCISRSEMDQELETLKKVVNLKSKMAHNWNSAHQGVPGQARRRRSMMAAMSEGRGRTGDERGAEKEREVASDNQRILELESKVMELSHKSPQHQHQSGSVLSKVNEVGGLVRMWGDQYTLRDRRLGSADDDNTNSGIVSLLDKSAQRILSIRTSGRKAEESDEKKAEDALAKVL